MDIRIQKLAQIIVDYSLDIKKDDLVVISGNDYAQDLLKEIYRLSLRKGAHPHCLVDIDEIHNIFYKEANNEQLEYVSPFDKVIMEKCTKFFTLFDNYNEYDLADIDPQKIKTRSAARRELMTAFYERCGKGEASWCGTLFPNNASAQMAGMSKSQYEEFVYGAMKLDADDPVAEWKKVEAEQDVFCNYLNNVKEFRVVSKDTDLVCEVAGRKWVNCCGKENFPDGEVFTTPIETKVNGKIRFSFPGMFRGKEIEDIYLEFKDGVVTKAHAAKGQELLEALLDTDEGSRHLGEIAVGTNYNIKNFTKNMLFDEKIGGTVHAALGASFPEAGGKNQSGIHWDMLCDMRNGGEIIADGKVIYKDGYFTIGK